jgi:HlyD family secretion protein
MTVSVDIEIERRGGTLALAAEAVHDATGPAPWVLQVRDGRAIRQPVTLGLRGDGVVEIRAGLEAGDLAVPASYPNVKPGERVRALPRE